MRKPKIILHGANGLFFEEAFLSFQNRFDIIAIADNDISLKGTKQNGLPITAPSDVCSFDFDFIAICCASSETNKTVFKQYVENYLVGPERIIDNAWILDSRLLSLLFVSNLLADEGVPGATAMYGAYMRDCALCMNMFFYDRKQFLYFPLKSEDLLIGGMPFPDDCIIKRGGGVYDSEVGHDVGFAFINLGTELYESTYECLEYFYPRMSKGGVMFVHSYYSSSQIGVRKAVDDFMKDNALTHFAKNEDVQFALVKS